MCELILKLANHNSLPGPSWICDRHDFICFDLEVILLLWSKFRLKSTKARFGMRCQKLIFKMVDMASILDFRSAQF